MAIYNGFTISVIGIIPFRGTYFGVNDTLNGINPSPADVIAGPTTDSI